MKHVIFVLAALTGLAAVAPGQPLLVYSEFARIDAKGNVTSPERPREILSPAVARNAFSSFQVVVQTGDEKGWYLHIGQNPENAVDVTMYRESGDRLEPVKLPIKGQGTQVFWMDLWTKGTATVERIKVEPQLNVDDDWVIYPMEVRVENPVVPEGKWPQGTTDPQQVMRGFVCQPPAGGITASGLFSPGVTADSLRFRNAQQDVALARKAPRADLLKLVGACNAAASPNPEFYLRIRDYLLRMR